MNIRRLLALVLTVALIFTLFPASGLAADVNHDISTGNAEITAGDGNNHIITGTSSANTITVTGTGQVNVTIDNISVMSSSGAFHINTGATVNLTLVGDNTLISGTNCAGIYVPDGATLNITSQSTGTLTTTGGSRAAGIGGNNGGATGAINISGGTVEATGGTDGAGIGGGNGNANSGTITIYGGSVDAEGTQRGAGIGSGFNSIVDSEVTITISGGSVIAQGGSAGGAGIGGDSYGSGGNITINGGTVQATAGWSAAGIGGGQMASGGDIVIAGGRVTAQAAGSGAGIGSGHGGVNGGTMHISDGTITALGGATGGAGIGGGGNGNGADVVIIGGSVRAVKGHANAQDIGHGSNRTDAGTLTNGEDDVFLTIITLEIVSAVTKVASLASAAGYGFADMYTDASGKLYLYLPEGTSTTQAITGGHSFLGEVITEDNEAPTEGILYRQNIYPTVDTLDITLADVGDTATFELTFGSGAYQADSFVLGPRDSDIVSATPDSGDKPNPVTITVTALAEGTTIIDVITFRNHNTHSMFLINIMVEPPPPALVSRMLTDSATGISVSGDSIHAEAELLVEEITLHEEGSCEACDAIRAKMVDESQTLILGKDLSLTHEFTGELTITLPVDARFNGETVTILHCNNGTLETLTVTAVNGQVTFTVTSISPVAVFGFTDQFTDDDEDSDEKDNATQDELDPIPQTGEGSAYLVWWVLCGICAAGIAALFIVKKKRSWRSK